MLNKVPQLELSMAVVSPAVVAHTKRPVRWKVLLVPGRDVILAYHNQVRWDSPASSVDSLDNCSPLAITWPYRFRSTTSLCASNNHVRVCPAHHKASFIKVVGVLRQDPKGTLYTLYSTNVLSKNSRFSR
jgi:hypothetical protein